MQQWERAEIARSAVEADLTPDDTLRVAPDIYARYVSPPADTAYPLEFAFHLIGDVLGKRIVDLGCGSGANTALLVNRGAQVWGIDISEDLLRLDGRIEALVGEVALDDRSDQRDEVVGRLPLFLALGAARQIDL